MSIEGFNEQQIMEYISKHSLRESEPLKKLRVETMKHERAEMISSPEAAQFIALQVEMLRAKRVIEVGVFTGYTTLAIANALPDDGQIIACDISEEYPAIGRPYWIESGVEDKIDLRIAPAEETMQQMIDQGEKVDAVFIDANKKQYPDYFDLAYELLNPGGLIIVDNTLGTTNQHAFNPEDDSNIASFVRAFNEKLANDHRVRISMLPFSQGITLALKI